MKTYNIQKDIIRIRKFFDLSQERFAKELNISRPSIARYETGTSYPEPLYIEKIYSYSYKNGLNLNKAKESFYQEDKKDNVLLFHGATGDIVGEIDNKHSILPNYFGYGFYAGGNLFQAASWIADKSNGSVYCFYFNNQNLKSMEFSVDRRWMYAILYYRGAFKNVEINDNIRKLVDEIESCDYLIAPIADNQMYQILNQFASNQITDEACIHALSVTNLGKQYVFKSMKACKQLEFVDRLYLCEKEKDNYLNDRKRYSDESISKANLAKIEYRRKGQYFDEIFKRI